MLIKNCLDNSQIKQVVFIYITQSNILYLFFCYFRLVLYLIKIAFYINLLDSITLNNNKYNYLINFSLWVQIRVLQHARLKVFDILNKIYQSSFTRLDSEINNFNICYKRLYQIVTSINLNKLNIDVKEIISLLFVIRLINNCLKHDFGQIFLIILASIVNAMLNQENLL